MLTGDMPLLVTFERVITEDYTLSDGFVIPAHTTIGVPAHAISMDPKLYPDPKKFDGFRFEKVREDPQKNGRAQYASSNPSSMAFGYGRHACPGRFFAANEIKAIMAYLLHNYDMKFREGQVRPESLLFETQYLPNSTATVCFKRRKFV
jgi:cytochrome P450